MNILQQLHALLPQPQRGIAELLAPKGKNVWRARTAAGAEVVLYGAGEAGARVFYDMKTGRVLENAPAGKVVEIKI